MQDTCVIFTAINKQLYSVQSLSSGQYELNMLHTNALHEYIYLRSRPINEN